MLTPRSPPVEFVRAEKTYDPDLLARCLAANGLPPAAPLLGSGPVRTDSGPSTLLLVPGRRPPALTGLVVTADCGTSGAGLVTRTEIPGG